MAKSIYINLSKRLVLLIFLPVCGLSAQIAVPQIPPGELITQVVRNELADRGRPDVWLYKVEHTQAGRTESRIQADTKFGPIYRVLARGGVPLNANQQRAEDARIQSLLSDSALESKNRKQQIDDEKHLDDLLALMPKGFLFEYDGFDDGRLRVKFRPDPNFNPPTYEARIFHALAGTILIDLDAKRIVRTQGRLQEPVEFGFGILGKLEQGGTFEFRRVHAIGDRWKTSWVELHISGHIIFFKSVAKDEKEVRSDFEALPPDTTLRQARDLLYK